MLIEQITTSLEYNKKSTCFKTDSIESIYVYKKFFKISKLKLFSYREDSVKEVKMKSV